MWVWVCDWVSDGASVSVIFCPRKMWEEPDTGQMVVEVTKSHEKGKETA